MFIRVEQKTSCVSTGGSEPVKKSVCRVWRAAVAKVTLGEGRVGGVGRGRSKGYSGRGT